MAFPSPPGIFNGADRPLYNGNISSVSVYNRQFEGATGGPLSHFNYSYDQLNRLTGMDRWTDDLGSNSWSGMSANDAMKERITYDPNGNILTYRRHSITGLLMDKLNYNYYSGTNQLRQINDTADLYNDGFMLDINNQTTTDNYKYDEIGN